MVLGDLRLMRLGASLSSTGASNRNRLARGFIAQSLPGKLLLCWKRVAKRYLKYGRGRGFVENQCENQVLF